MLSKLKPKNCIIAFLSSSLQAFGMYNIHARADITEGGVLGMTLLLEHWFSISPAVSGFVLNAACYFLGWRTLGKQFIACSLIAAAGFSVTYGVCELFPPLWPEIASYPMLAALLGALFIGIGAGLCVRSGGATCGDDALAMSLSHITRVPIQWVYLVSDLTVLGLSLSYLPVSRIALITAYIFPWQEHSFAMISLMTYCSSFAFSHCPMQKYSSNFRNNSGMAP